MPVGHFEQRLERSGEPLSPGSRRVEDWPELLLEVVGEPLQQPRDEALLGHPLSPQRHARAFRALRDALQGYTVEAEFPEHRFGCIQEGIVHRWTAYRLPECNIYVSLSEPNPTREGVMPIAGSDEQGVVLRLTAGEVEALDAVTRGVGALAGRTVDREAAVNAALELALVRLTEDFELPAGDADSVRQGLESMRSTWSRGNACIT